MPAIATEAKSQQPGHDNCAPTKFTAVQQSIVKVNGSLVLCVGDQAGGHSCGKPYEHPYHIPVIAEGSSIVKINGKPVALDGKALSGCPVPNQVSQGDELVKISN